MEDDLICSLTRQVKEEVIENYLTERCIVGLQIEEIQNRAEELKAKAAKTGVRLSRMAYLMTHPDMTRKLVQILGIPSDSLWAAAVDRHFTRNARYIRVRALTNKRRFRKLVLEAYDRFYFWMKDYRKAYDDFIQDCRAVNSNISRFQKNYDLLTILSFLKSMDTRELERKQYLGENFTADEMASIDQKLYLPPVDVRRFDLPEPLDLPTPDTVESALEDLASEVYRKYESSVRSILM